MDQDLSGRIKAARENAGLSLREASALMKLAPSTLMHWEAGTHCPRVADVPIICAALGCKPRWLVFGPQRRRAA